MEEFKTHIWHNSPSCKTTFESLIKIINELIQKVNELEKTSKKNKETSEEEI